jgi:soluble lytic murein transglycosylase-like protein
MKKKLVVFGYMVGSALTLGGLYYWYMKKQIPEDAPKTLPWRVARWWDKIKYYAGYFGLDPILVASIIQVESGGDPNARNPNSTATGLMQVLYGTAKQMGVDPDLLTDPDWNLYAGCKYLRQKLDEYGDVWKAVYSYYAGKYPSATHPEAKPYADKVIALYNKYSAVYV